GGAPMGTGRTLLLAVDGLADGEGERVLPAGATRLRIRPGGPSEPAPALVGLLTGASVAQTGVATQDPFRPDRPSSRTTWYARSLRVPTLSAQARRAGLVTAALQWPATAGAEIDLCLPLVEDLGHYRNRWEMAELTSSPRMAA